MIALKPAYLVFCNCLWIKSSETPEARRPSVTTRLVQQKLPKSLSSVSDVLKAWNEGVKGLPPMRLFVGNKHSTLRTDRSERKRLSDHKRVVMAVELLGRKHELDSNGEPRPLRVIRAMLEEEAQKK